MVINDVQFNVELIDILTELQSQLASNGIQLLSKLKETTEDVMIQCPYHNNGQERRPSAGIRKSDGLFHCLACGETHSLQEVISYCFGKTDDIIGMFGWQWLLKNFVSINVEERKDVQIDCSRTASRTCDREFISEEELDSYRYTHPYMYKRKLTDEIIELFDIGYDKTTRCITFPVRDIKGNTLFIARRSVTHKYFNYPQGVEKPLYGLYELNKCISGGRGSAKINWTPILMSQFGEVIVCESMLDALTCWVRGKPAVALNGLGNELQFKQLETLPCRELILATDNDKAGLKARKRIRENIHTKLISEYVLPQGKKDINELSKDEFENLSKKF